MKLSGPVGCGIVALIGCLLSAGCDPLPPSVELKSFRTVLTIAPSERLRDQIRTNQVKFIDLKKRGAEFALAAHSIRSQPGYSVKQLSRDFHEFLLTSGAMAAAYDINFQWTGSGADEVSVSGSFKLAAIRDVSVPDESSWVVQAGWQTVPRQGEFGFRLPKTAENTEPAQMNDAVRSHVESVLSNSIESELHRLLESDVLKRFESRKAVYGYGDCIPEAAPQEDGIDCLAVLGLAQQFRDRKYPPAFLSEEPDDWANIVSLARKICGLMLPKEWRSVLRERLKARPVLLSKKLVVLELATGGKPLAINRNAFTEEGEKRLLRMEDVMVEFLARVNGAKASAAKRPKNPVKGVDPWAIPADSKSPCESCGHKGPFQYDEDGNGFFPLCETLQESGLPEPLTGRAGFERIKP